VGNFSSFCVFNELIHIKNSKKNAMELWLELYTLFKLFKYDDGGRKNIDASHFDFSFEATSSNAATAAALTPTTIKTPADDTRASLNRKSQQPSVTGGTSTTTTVVNSSSSKSKLVKVSASIKDATFFDVAVLRCLLCPKWNSEGYLWSLEYLSYRVVEITDLMLKEQDTFFQVRSASLPAQLNEMCVLMGVGSFDVAASAGDDELLGGDEDLELLGKPSKMPREGSGGGVPPGNNEFIELINQIHLETDFSSSSKLSFSNMYYYMKRKKYEANFQTRIRFAF
jgi:hypothetical protein